MKRTKKILSLLLSSCILVGSIPHISHASEPCEHHTEHTDTCGFIESHEGTACNHNHTDDCYTEVEFTKEVNICSHACTDEELSISANNGVCNHICDDNCISTETEITKELNCQHTDHTDACGYSEGIEGVECSHECNICKLQSLVDSLQDGVSSDEEKSIAEASLTEIDTLKSSLSDEELSQVDFTKYTSLINALNTYYTGGESRVNEPIMTEITFTDTLMTEVYVKFTDSNSSVGEGTEENPFNYFVEALRRVEENGTIYILGNANITAGDGQSQNGSDMLPFIINKSVTIEGIGTDARLNLRPAGIILGADVTFKNIKIGLESKEKNAIFANGHKLELINCGKHSGGREVHIFAGSVNGSLAGQGSKSEIIINGTSSSFGNVYGGSMNTSFDKQVEITISNIERNGIGSVYASGAATGVYNPNDILNIDTPDPDPPVANEESFPSVNDVVINLNNTTIGDFNGQATTSKKATVSIARQDDYLYEIGYANVGDLIINSGVVGISAVPDSILIKSGATLSVVSLIDSGFNEINKLEGETGSKLIVPQDESLIINFDFTGNIILKTNHVYGYTNERIYIEGSPDYTGQFTYEFDSSEYDRELVSIDGDWTVRKKGSGGSTVVEDTLVKSFSFNQTSLEVEPSRLYDDDYEQVELNYATNSKGNKELNDFPLDYSVSYNNNVYTKTGNSTAVFTELNLQFEAFSFGDAYMNICKINNTDLSSGVYTITVTIPDEYTEDGTALSSIFTLTVTGDSGSTGNGGTTSCEHTPTGDYEKDTATHWKICSKCGEAVDEGIHTAKDNTYYPIIENDLGGSLSIYHAKKCVCGEFVDKKQHVYDDYINHQEDGHTGECTTCNYIVDVPSEHQSASSLTWVSKDSDPNNHYKICKCGYEVASEAHNIAYQSSETHHWQGCECGYIVGGEKEAHTPESDKLYSTDGGHGKRCKCGKTIDIEQHVFDLYSDVNDEYHFFRCKCSELADGFGDHTSKDGVWYSDENTHYQLCVCGHKLEESRHDAVDSLDWQYSDNSTEHYKVCSCGRELARESHSKIEGKYESDSSGHWGICECGYIVGDKEEHDYKFIPYGSKDYYYYGHKEECTVCKYEPSTSIIDHSPVGNTYYKDDSTFEHYQLCICGEELNREKHKALDTYTSDEKSHYKHCICGQQMSREDHKPGAEATETSDQVCLDCNFVIKEMLNHSHDWGTWTSNGDNTHTRVCKTNSNHTETLTCSGGVATCKDKATCTTCNEEYGNLNSSKHIGKTEVRDKTNTYTGDTYCLDCDTKIATGSKITSGDENSGSSSGTGGSSNSSSSSSSSSSSNQNNNNSYSGSSSSSNTTSENTNKSTNTSNNTITNTGNNTPEKPTSTLTTNKHVIVIEEYTIKRGDTLSKIARRYGCTLEELINTNKDVIKNPNLIHIGWKLNIPTKKVGSESNSINGVNNTTLAVDINNSESYVIQQGDSLWKISRKYGCTIEELLAYNKDTIKNPNLIIAGKKLRIPKR